MHGQDCEQLMLFQEDSHASHFPWLESKKEKGMTVTYGRKCSGLSESLRRVGLSVRTYLESCELPGERFARTWSVRDTLSPYLILKLRLSERRTDESEFSLWRTPASADSDGRGTYATFEAFKAGRVDKGKQISLANQIKFPQMWPTPRAQEYKDTLQSLPPSRIKDPGKCNLTQRVAREMLYPTPTTGAGLCGGTGNFQQLQKLKDHGCISEDERRSMSQGNGGQLNPTWVEWLMGFPIGLTDLSASETP